MSRTASAKKTIVVVGGGPAGLSTAQSLSKALDGSRFNVQLVTERTFFVHWPAMIRTLATSEGSLEELVLIPYDRAFKPGQPGEVIIGAVESVTDGAVHLADGRTLPYDWLVLATGRKNDGPLALPIDRDETVQWIKDWRTRITKARSVVLVGGGAVGVELAGEIHHFHPTTTVTMIHADPLLMNGAYPDKFRRATQKALESRGVHVILADRALVNPDQSSTLLKTEKGREIESDLVIATRGGRLNTAFLSSFDSSILTPSGTVRVLPTLQVPLANGKTNVYALGDIMEWKEQKMAAKTASQSAVVAANIVSDTQGRPIKKKYGGFMEGLIMPFGPNGGIGFLPLLWGIILGNWFSKLIKSKGLFVQMTRKVLGY